MRNVRVLFICKNRGYGPSLGLFLSAEFVSKSLESIGIPSKAVIVVDANSINKEVHCYKPTHVILEALWVAPEKLKELVGLHPLIKWIVRVHSEIPFIAYEGVAFEWMFKYQAMHNVWVAANSKTMNEDLEKANIYSSYLPNIYYPAFLEKGKPVWDDNKGIIDIGCFGAIRPLKNQLKQGIAAIAFADEKKKTLNFHINAGRVEQNGNSVLKNLRALFRNNAPHKLIEHAWLKHEEFIKWVKRMDLGMQVSFSETFNIVTADFVDNNIPIVVSKEVPWMPSWTKAESTDMEDIIRTMELCYYGRKFKLQYLNKIYLLNYNYRSLGEWVSYLLF